MRIKEAELGEGHPITANTYYELSKLMYRENRIDEEKTFLQLALAAFETVRKPQDPLMVEIRQRLGSL